jgi:hypothetical protein
MVVVLIIAVLITIAIPTSWAPVVEPWIGLPSPICAPP